MGRGIDIDVIITKLLEVRGSKPGKAVNFGFAIHDDHTAGRFHHVSLGYTLGLDTKADISAAKQ